MARAVWAWRLPAPGDASFPGSLHGQTLALYSARKRQNARGGCRRLLCSNSALRRHNIAKPACASCSAAGSSALVSDQTVSCCTAQGISIVVGGSSGGNYTTLSCSPCGSGEVLARSVALLRAGRHGDQHVSGTRSCLPGGGTSEHLASSGITPPSPIWSQRAGIGCGFRVVRDRRGQLPKAAGRISIRCQTARTARTSQGLRSRLRIAQKMPQGRAAPSVKNMAQYPRYAASRSVEFAPQRLHQRSQSDGASSPAARCIKSSASAEATAQVVAELGIPPHFRQRGNA